MRSGLKGVEKHVPHGFPLGTANHGSRKQVIVAWGKTVKR